MGVLKSVFDLLDGLFLGIKTVTPLIITFFTFTYVEKIMEKKQGIKKYHFVLAFVPVIAVWIMADPGSFPDKLQALPFWAYIPGVASVVLGGLSIFHMAGDRQTPDEEKIEKLSMENESLRKERKNLEFWKTYYQNLYEKDHPDES